jgi:hypothetical protein
MYMTLTGTLNNKKLIVAVAVSIKYESFPAEKSPNGLKKGFNVWCSPVIRMSLKILPDDLFQPYFSL